MPASLYELGREISGVTRGLSEAMPMIQSLATIGTPLSATAIKARSLGIKAPSENVLSANAIIRAVRQQGFQVQRKAALQVIKAVKQTVADSSYFATLGKGRLPAATKIPFSPFGYTQKYQYHVAVTYTDAGGVRRQQFATMLYSRRVTLAEAEFDAAAAISTGENYDTLFVEAADTQVVTKSPHF